MSKPYSPRTLTHKLAAQALADLLWTFNLADSQVGAAWTTPKMASAEYGHTRKLLNSIGGKKAWDKWIETGDLDLDLLVSPSGKKPKPRQSILKAKGIPLKPGNPHPKRKRGGYRVCVRTTKGGWGNWNHDPSENLSGPKADALMRKLRRQGYEVAKFQGRKRVK